MSRWIFFVSLTLIACQQKTPVADATNLPLQNPHRVTCTQAKDIRQLEIRPINNSGCGLYYKKFNTEKSIATAANDSRYCEEVSQKIVHNLKSSGFLCE